MSPNIKDIKKPLAIRLKQNWGKFYKRATPEESAYFRRKGEGLATQGLSQAQIDRELARDARNFTNQLKKLDETPGARARHKVGQAFKGTGRTDEQRRREIHGSCKASIR